MKYTIYKNEIGQLMAMEGWCEFDGVVDKVASVDDLQIYKDYEYLSNLLKEKETTLDIANFRVAEMTSRLLEMGDELTKLRQQIFLKERGRL